MSINKHIKNEKPTVFGMGLIALDLVISSDVTTPVNYWAGGTCGNVLTILSFLGWDSYPVACMNSNSASMRVKNDLFRWNVNLDYTELLPSESTPIIVQEILREDDGKVAHKFSWICPKCGASLPNYTPVTADSARIVSEQLSTPQVFFFDRASPAALLLARKCKEMGAVVVFEPSVQGNKDELMAALSLAHIVKYSNERFSSIGDLNGFPSCALEIKTMGASGLAFRLKGNKNDINWVTLPSVRTGQVVDTCGCGDWTTAGLIARVCGGGFHGLQTKSLEQIVAALNYGQALASWNCGFEGARGGMYQTDPERFDSEIACIIDNKKLSIPPVGFDTKVNN